MSDLERFYDFLSAFSSKAALHAVNTLRNAVSQLIIHPRLGSILPGFEGRELRRLVIGDYEMRYEVVGEAIHILRFFHSRENR